jgi:hypothetical protein
VAAPGPSGYPGHVLEEGYHRHDSSGLTDREILELFIMAPITGVLFALLATAANSLAQASIDRKNLARDENPFELAAQKVRGLAPKSFRILPKKIANELERRHCQIPQDDTARQGDITNVIHGSFFARASSDWAVLCNEKVDSYILVFRQGDADHPSKLASAPVINSLEGIGNDLIGYVRRITTLDRQRFAKYYALGKDRKVTLTYDAISDAMSDKFESVYYWKYDKWEVVRVHASE